MSAANHSYLGKYFEFFETILVEVTGATNPCIELYQNGIFACCIIVSYVISSHHKLVFWSLREQCHVYIWYTKVTMKDLFLYPLPDFRGCQLRPLQPCWGSGKGYQCQSVSRLHWNPSELDWTVRARSPIARKGLPSGKLGHSLCVGPSVGLPN